MKKVLVASILFAFIVSVSSVAFAASSANIGYIEVQKVFSSYKETEKAQKDLEKQEAGFKKEFEDSQKQLEKAEKEGKKTEELDKMRKDLETKLAPKRDTLIKLNQQLTIRLQQDILEAVKKVSKKVGIETVLDKQVVINGGIDLTELVINELNK